VMIHRAILGSLERFIGVLIEQYGGNMPLWLAPEHARILPISEKTSDYAVKLEERLKTEGLRVSTDMTAEKIGAKIARTHAERLPYMLVIGPKEAEADEVNVRIRGQEHAKNVKVSEFVSIVKQKIAQRQIDVAF
jgi:threonyl-tRNA synthetase